MSITALRAELGQLDKEIIIDMVVELYKKHKSVKEHFDLILNQNETGLFEKYKIKVKEAFFPKRGFGYKLKEGKKAISDFRKLNPSENLIAELMLYYVECGIKFTSDYGDIDEPFYNSLESTYHMSLKFISRHKMLDQFKIYAKELANSTYRFGWGLYDSLIESYNEFYKE